MQASMKTVEMIQMYIAMIYLSTNNQLLLRIKDSLANSFQTCLVCIEQFWSL